MLDEPPSFTMVDDGAYLFVFQIGMSQKGPELVPIDVDFCYLVVFQHDIRTDDFKSCRIHPPDFKELVQGDEAAQPVSIAMDAAGHHFADLGQGHQLQRIGGVDVQNGNGRSGR